MTTTREALLRRAYLRSVAETVGETTLFVTATSIIVVVFLIFFFVFQKAIPIFDQTATNAKKVEQITVAELDAAEPAALAAFLGLSGPDELALYDRETIEIMVEALEVDATASVNPDRYLNTLEARHLFAPRQWHGGQYDAPAYVWQPVSEVPKYNVVPLFVGSLKATLVAMLFAVPLAFVAALYVSQFAGGRARRFIKPAIEMLSGIPSVVLGMFGLMLVASFLQRLAGYEARLNAMVAGVTLGLAVIPIVFTVMEDVLSSVPRAYRDASLALGATPWQTAVRVIVPAAIPGLFAATVLGFGRAIGETMVVLMVSGNAPRMSWSLLDPIRTITATIAAELPDVQFGDTHYQMLFFLGSLLFAVTFVTNFGGDLVVARMKQRLEGKA